MANNILIQSNIEIYLSRLFCYSRAIFAHFLIIFNFYMNTLSAISPLDGRYRKKIEPLANYFSEYALIKYRVWVEIEYFIALNTEANLPRFEPLSAETIGFLRSIYLEFSEEDAQQVKDIERVTNHDVKAVEYFIKKKIEEKEDAQLAEYKEFIHFGLTSQNGLNCFCQNCPIRI